MDYAAALDKVGGGTQAQESQKFNRLWKKYWSRIRYFNFKSSYKITCQVLWCGKGISKFEDLGRTSCTRCNYERCRILTEVY